MIFCKELDKTFKDKKELFKELKANKKLIIDAKKSQILKSMDKGQVVKSRCLDPTKIEGANKSLFDSSEHYYIVVNTTNVLDSHRDLHAKGIWNKTAKEQNGKNYLVDTHNISLSTTIARKENVEIFIAEIPFSMVGKNYEGTTEALIYKVAKDKVINQTAKEWLDSGDEIQASVSMQYVNIVLALNSDDNEDKTERYNFDSYKTQIANKEDFNNLEYFWIVKEAKNIGESSLVLFGSNPVTGQLKVEPSQDTQKNEPSQDIQDKEKERLEIYRLYK